MAGPIPWAAPEGGGVSAPEASHDGSGRHFAGGAIRATVLCMRLSYLTATVVRTGIFIAGVGALIAALTWGAFRLVREPSQADARAEVAQEAGSFPEIRKAFARGRPDRALAMIEGLPPGEAGTPEALALRARAHLLTGKRDLAEKAARAAVSADPGQSEAWCTLGLILQTRGELAGAEEALDKSVAADPDAPGPVLARAKVRQERGRQAEALDDYLLYLTARPHDPAALGGRGVALATLGRNEEAIKDLDAALAASPRDGWLRYHRALVLDGLGAPADALAEIDRALRMTPEMAPLWALKGRVLARLGHRGEALAAVDAALQRNPGFAPALQLKAELSAGPAR